MGDEPKEAVNRHRDVCYWCNGKTIPIFHSKNCMICIRCENPKNDKNAPDKDSKTEKSNHRDYSFYS